MGTPNWLKDLLRQIISTIAILVVMYLVTFALAWGAAKLITIPEIKPFEQLITPALIMVWMLVFIDALRFLDRKKRESW